MSDTEPQTADGRLLWHFTMSLDGFVTGPNHQMDWMAGISSRPGLVDGYVETTGAVLGGRDGWDASPDPSAVLWRCVGRTHRRAHPPSRGCNTRRRGHVPEL